NGWMPVHVPGEALKTPGQFRDRIAHESHVKPVGPQSEPSSSGIAVGNFRGPRPAAQERYRTSAQRPGQIHQVRTDRGDVIGHRGQTSLESRYDESRPVLAPKLGLPVDEAATPLVVPVVEPRPGEAPIPGGRGGQERLKQVADVARRVCTQVTPNG